MKKRKGIMGGLISLIFFIIIAGIILAVARQFNGDIIEAIIWIFNYIWGLIVSVAEKVGRMTGFRKLFT